MKPTRNEFLSGDKAITLIGMSGVGKSYLSAMLAQSGWRCCSCDLLIGQAFQAAGHIDVTHRITLDDLRAVSAFVGMLGNPEAGGLDLPEFQRRQKLYYEAEHNSLRQVYKLAAEPGNLVVDTTGSFCEIDDDALIDSVAGNTLIVYLQASDKYREALVERAWQYPKPLYYPYASFPDWMNDYMREKGIETVTAISPPDFGRWVFPRLLESRIPKYERLAERGLVVPADDLKNIKSLKAFTSYIANQL